MNKTLLNSILLLSFMTILASSCSERNYSLESKTWDAYRTYEKGGDTTNNYLITYTFNSDGTFTESHKFRDTNMINSSLKKMWELDDNLLKITLTRLSYGAQRTTEYPFKWLSRSKFFVVEETDELTNIESYVYCYARQ